MNDCELLPPIDENAAKETLAQVDRIVTMQRKLVDKVDKSSMELAPLVYEVSTKGYWMCRGHKSETEYIEKVFGGSRTQYYVLKRVWGCLGHLPRQLLQDIGVSKCNELVKVHEHNAGTIEDHWIEDAKKETRDVFREIVRAHITNKLLPPPDPVGTEFITIKIFPDQRAIWKKAMEIMSLESGSDKSISYLVHLLCVEFLSGHNEEGPRLE